MEIMVLKVAFITLMVLNNVYLCFGQCGDNEFSCKDGLTCVENSTNYICDGIIKDCPDGDDEAPDFCGDCNPNEFLCWNGTCINGDWTCDTVYDCEDGEDELLCPQNCSAVKAYECQHLRECLYWSYVCDGEEDCVFGDDENEEMCSTGCGAGNITCPGTPTEVCKPASTVCDGNVDCPGATDELNFCNPDYDRICDVPGFLRCEKSNGTTSCIDPTFKCDGEYDCPNQDDEPESCPTEMNCNGNFKCNETTCVTWMAECDGYNDCTDGEDELPKNQNCASCNDTQYRCFGGKCIDIGLVCNEFDDCQFYDDEDFCENTNMTASSTLSAASTTPPTTSTASTTNTNVIADTTSAAITITPIMNFVGIFLCVASVVITTLD